MYPERRKLKQLDLRQPYNSELIFRQKSLALARSLGKNCISQNFDEPIELTHRFSATSAGAGKFIGGGLVLYLKGRDSIAASRGLIDNGDRSIAMRTPMFTRPLRPRTSGQLTGTKVVKNVMVKRINGDAFEREYPEYKDAYSLAVDFEQPLDFPQRALLVNGLTEIVDRLTEIQLLKV